MLRAPELMMPDPAEDFSGTPRALLAGMNSAIVESSPKVPRNGRRVLVAEDDESMRDLIVTSLRADGYDVTAAGDLDCLGETVGVDIGPDAVAMIVTDNRMPGCTGLELLTALRAARWQTPVILITAFGSVATHRHAVALGATAVLDKPFRLEQLRALVRDGIRPC